MANYFGNTAQQVHEAILGAFDAQSLAMMLRFRLGLRWGNVVTPTVFKYQVLELLDEIERAGWEQDLLEAIYRERPRNVKVKEVYERAGLAPRAAVQAAGANVAGAPATAVEPGFERMVRDRLGFLDMGIWAEKLSQVMGQVCRITIAGQAAGTGFLIGADRVLTNFHVVQDLISGQGAEALACEFDYRKISEGTFQVGRAVKLVKGARQAWLLDSSSYSQGEAGRDPQNSLPTMDELDHAVLRLAEPIGDQPADAKGNAADGAPARGWIKFPEAAPSLAEGDPLLIVQYPEGRPLKLAVDTNSILGLNSAGNRLRYATNTEPGSSGSPCFNFDWALVALHHYGDPARGHSKFNQGIVAEVLRKRLADKGLLA